MPFDIIAVLTTIIGGLPIFEQTFEAIRQHFINMEAPMTIGAAASRAIGEFIPAAVIIFFALLAEEQESLTMQHGRRAIASLFVKAPKMATVQMWR